MYKVRAKYRRGIKRIKYPKKFPHRKAARALYFSNWDSACSFCATAGLRLKQISLV